MGTRVTLLSQFNELLIIVFGGLESHGFDEVNGMDPKDFTIHTVPARLGKKGDLFHGILGKGAALGILQGER